MCGGTKVPPPDPAIGQAAHDQIDFARQQYADYMAPGGDRDFMRSTTDRALAMGDESLNVQRESLGIQRRSEDRASELQQYELGQARRNDDRYFGVAVPFEDQLLKQVNDQDTDSYRDGQVQRALADTEMQFSNARQQGLRAMNRRGANPDSGAYGAMMADGGRAQALAMATAANKTRLASQQVGLSNKMQMYGGMKGLAGLGATSASLALGANGQALNAGQGMGNTAAGMLSVGQSGIGASGAYLGANNSAAGLRTSGLGAGISGLNAQYGNQVAAAKVQADSDPFNTILGAAAGAGMRYFTGGLR